MKFVALGIVSAIATLSTSLAMPLAAQAESRQAYCRYFPNGFTNATIAMPCVFSMSQGNVDINWEDGVSDHFRLNGFMTYTDERGGIVYQQRDEDANGASVRIFKMKNGSIHIWGS